MQQRLPNLQGRKLARPVRTPAGPISVLTLGSCSCPRGRSLHLRETDPGLLMGLYEKYSSTSISVDVDQRFASEHSLVVRLLEESICRSCTWLYAPEITCCTGGLRLVGWEIPVQHRFLNGFCCYLLLFPIYLEGSWSNSRCRENGCTHLPGMVHL